MDARTDVWILESKLTLRSRQSVEMTGRLQWVKSTPRNILQDGRNMYELSGNKGLKGSFQVMRLLLNNLAIGSSRSYRTRERRQAAPADGAGHHLQNGTALKEIVASLIRRVYEGATIDSHTYVDCLQRISEQKHFDSLNQVHACINKSGLEQNHYVANSLLKCYIGCGRLQNAQQLFNLLLNKTIVSWTTMIGGYAEHNQAEEAMKVYNQMRSEGVQPNVITYLSALKACASPRSLHWGKDLHAQIIHDGHEADTRVGSTLVSMYAKCGSIEDARAAFDRMESPNVVCWNAMMAGLAQHGQGREGFSLFHKMQSFGITPNSTTYLCLLNARADLTDLAWVKEVHSHAKKSEFARDVRVNTALIHMYAMCGSMSDAKLVFSTMRSRNIISWNAMIGGLARHGHGHEAFSCFQQMEREGVVPDAATYMSILNSNASEGALAWVKGVHTHATRSGLNADLRVDNALLNMYAKCGSIEDARAVFQRMQRRDVVSWTAMIGGLAEHGLGHEAFSLFLQMQREGFIPDPVTYKSILNPSSSTGALEWVKEVHADAIKAGLDVHLSVGNALVRMYAKIGSIDDAKQVFDNMVDRDVVTWTVMIGGLAQHGHGQEALQHFKEMKFKGVKPDGQLFVAVLSACSHAGLVDEGVSLFASMTRDYGIEHELEHYNCMVDILGRAGNLVEAKLFILNMPIKPDVVTWKSLLSACKTHNNIKLAELAAEECVKLDPMDPSPYVLLANVYAAAGMWNQKSSVLKRMEGRGIRKDPGLCWIEVDNKLHSFIAGDTSHPESKEIYGMLNGLSAKLKAEGYIPDTQRVLHNIDAEHKEIVLCSHSEKLAIAYGLLHLTSRKPIRIYKNLRICTDCHTASKLISKITGREIVARDANRFHHFKDGLCSCNEFW